MFITKDDVKITVTAEDNKESVRSALRGCEPKLVNSILETQKKSLWWGWCKVKVQVQLKDGPVLVFGVAYLSNCSYLSKKDFIENSGYYDQMVYEAIYNLSENLKNMANQISDLLTLWGSRHPVVNNARNYFDSIVNDKLSLEQFSQQSNTGYKF